MKQPRWAAGGKIPPVPPPRFWRGRETCGVWPRPCKDPALPRCCPPCGAETPRSQRFPSPLWFPAPHPGGFSSPAPRRGIWAGGRGQGCGTPVPRAARGTPMPEPASSRFPVPCTPRAVVWLWGHLRDPGGSWGGGCRAMLCVPGPRTGLSLRAERWWHRTAPRGVGSRQGGMQAACPAFPFPREKVPGPGCSVLGTLLDLMLDLMPRSPPCSLGVPVPPFPLQWLCGAVTGAFAGLWRWRLHLPEAAAATSASPRGLPRLCRAHTERGL